jgi:FAD:protein FMN transferase
VDRHELRFGVMGTEAHVVVLDGPAGLAEWARTRLEDLERRWSRFLEDSEISQLNRAAGRPVVVSPETCRIVADAIEAWRWTGGGFDPTVGTTMVEAGYDRPFPRGEPIGSLVVSRPVEHRPCPTPAGIVVDPYPGSVTLPAGVRLDLGGIGKGAAADLVAAELLAAGAAGCCVNLGGDLRVAGIPPRPGGWTILVEPERAARLGLADGAVCTSTRTRRTWLGSRGPEHHLRDPGTGAPLDTGLATVTVVGATAAQAEVLTKAAFTAGRDRAEAVIAGAGATGLLVTDDGTVVRLPGLDPFLRAGSAPLAETVG